MPKPPTPTQRRVMEAMRDGEYLCNRVTPLGSAWHLCPSDESVGVRTVNALHGRGWLFGAGTHTPGGRETISDYILTPSGLAALEGAGK